MKPDIVNSQGTGAAVVQQRLVRRFGVGDVVRMPHYELAGKERKRVWKITEESLGGNNQEGTYGMIPLDIADNEPIQVPCLILETHPEIEKV
jgi:hypothetical protein